MRQSTVKVDGQSYNSIEVKGPVLPDAVYNFCDLLSSSLKKFTATFANLESTKPFTLASESNKGTNNKYILTLIREIIYFFLYTSIRMW